MFGWIRSWLRSTNREQPNYPASRMVVLLDGKPYIIADQYVLDESTFLRSRDSVWNQAEFKTSDAIRFNGSGTLSLDTLRSDPKRAHLESRGEVIKRGWDHEHCNICWKTITDMTTNDSVSSGFINDEGSWLCVDCYRAIIEPESIAIVPGTIAD